MPENSIIRNIAVIRTDRIGEVLLSTAAIEALKRKFPDAAISFVTSEYSRPLLEGRYDLDEIFVVDTMAKGGLLQRAIRLASFLKRKKIDLAVVLNPHKALHLGCFLAGVPVRAGYDRKWGFLLNKKVPDKRDKGQKHEVEYTLDLLRVLDVPPITPEVKLYVSGKAEDAATIILGKEGMVPGKPLIAVHPASSNYAKLWPAERYAELIGRMKKELDVNVAVLGTKEEEGLVSGIVEKAGPGVMDLAGELDLETLAAVLKRAVLFVGNDTGPMHMAAALGIPVIAIFGRNIPGVSPRRWRPWGSKHVVFHEDTGCFPCYDVECPYDHKCLKAVTVNAVFEAVSKMFRES